MMSQNKSKIRKYTRLGEHERELANATRKQKAIIEKSVKRQEEIDNQQLLKYPIKRLL